MQLTPDQSNWLVVAALASPHILYAYIWFFPQQWMTAFKSKSVDIFAWIATVLKGTLPDIITF
jgi:hypothetical protein